MNTSRLYLSALAALAVLLGACSKPEEQKPSEKPNPDPTPSEQKTPVIKAEAFSAGAQAGTYVLPVTVENPVQGKSLQARLPEAAGWLTLGSATAEGIPVTVSDNLSDARSTRVELSYEGAQAVTVEITQPQWAWPEFGIETSGLGPFGITVTITRKPGYSGGYFFEVLDKASFNKYVKDDTHKVGEFAYGEALYQGDVAYLNRLAESHGHPLGQLFTMLQSMYSKEESVTMPYSSLSVDTDYVFVVYGMKDDDTAERKTPICLYEFHTGYSEDSALSFSGMAHDVTENYAELHVKASNNTEYWYMNWVSEIQLQSTTLAEVMQSSITNAKTLLSRYSAEQILCHGEETLQATDLMPGTEYTVVAWGMNLNMEATTAPQAVFTFRTKEYAIVDDCRFQIDVLEVEDMDVKVKVTPTNTGTRYYVAFVEKSKMSGYSDEQAAQRIINMESQRIEQGYYDVPNLSWENLPGMGTGVREIWGRRDEGWTFLPNHDYRIYVFGVDNFGIRSTAVDAIDVTTAEPGVSQNHFQVTIDSNTWLGLDFTVTPEINDEYWMEFLAETADIDQYFRNTDGSLKEKELFEWIEEYYEDEIAYHSFHGQRTLHEHVTPDTDYTILIFGYSGTYTTAMYEWQVSVPKPPLGKSTADFTYTYELFRGEDLSALDPLVWPLADYDGDCIMVLRLTPTENAVHWYLGMWPPKENFADQGGLYYLMTLDMNPNVAGSAMQDKRVFRNRPWWYGASKDWKWVDEQGDIVNHWPWTISGWAEDKDGNYGPLHYDYLIPVPVPKGQETGKYEVGYTEAYDFWSNPSGAPMQIFRASDGLPIKF